MTTTSSLTKDPVCGMMVDPAKAKASVEHNGATYYFCCPGCAQKFEAHPQEYLKPRSATPLVTLGAPKPVAPSRNSQPPPPGDVAYACPMCPEVRKSKPGPCPSCGMALEREIPAPTTKTEYTCPMHPQIVRPGPGTCPICGMALEPRTVAAVEEDNHELRDMTRRFWV